MTSPRPWAMERASGPAAAFHGRELPSPARRMVWIFSVDQPALVLGSTQPDSVVDRERVKTAGVDLVRRHSGGGAVLLVPDENVWVDAVIPRDDPLWADDVGAAFAWFGHAWAGALADLGIEAEVHDGALVSSPWSPLVCFAGLGPGEVSVGGRKVMGLSQRRTRAGARFQAVAHRVWDPAPLLDLLSLDAADRADAGRELSTAAAGVDLEPSRLHDALLERLCS